MKTPNKKRRTKLFIHFIFILPFVMCMSTVIGIKSFTVNHILNTPEIIEQNLLSVVDSELKLITERKMSPEQEKAEMVKVTKSIDVQEGIGATLFKKTSADFDIIYNFNINQKSDISGVKILDDYFRPDELIFVQDSHFIGSYHLKALHRGVEVTYTFYFATYKDYVVVWCVRPDFVLSYFVNANKMFLIISFVLLLNAISSFISLVAYYQLENRAIRIVRKRSEDV
jgi:hypothetical protein